MLYKIYNNASCASVLIFICVQSRDSQIYGFKKQMINHQKVHCCFLLVSVKWSWISLPKASSKEEGAQPHINIATAKQPGQCGTNSYPIPTLTCSVGLGPNPTLLAKT